MGDQATKGHAVWEGDLFRLFVENVRDYAIFVVDPEGKVRTWSHGCELLLGYHEEEVLGRTADLLFTPEDVQGDVPRREMRQALETGRGEDDRWQVRKDGSRLWVSGVMTPLRDEQGRHRGFAKIMRDRTEWRLADQARRESEEGARLLLNSTAEAIYGVDTEGRCTFCNPACARALGYERPEDLLGRNMHELSHHTRPDGTPYPEQECRIYRAFRQGVGTHADDEVLWRADGSRFPAEYHSYPVRRDDRVIGSVVTFNDITARRRAEATIAEQVRLAEYGRDVGRALTQGGTLEEVLDRCAAATVRHLDAAFARVWTVDDAGAVLELRASAGMYTHTDGPHGRVPVGQYKIGLIARERVPHLTNAVIGDPRIPAQDWARAEGMVAFAGYPLVVDDRLVGVVAMFARHELSDATLRALASVADEVAIGIERKRTEERLHRQREWLRVTLASIGDAVIATDLDGRVTFLNGVAEALTGWRQPEAEGADLAEVFRIVNERTRRPVESPALRALREGAVVGLANHTVLIARDGTERAIDDSAAPIRDESGAVMGAVLIFRDVDRKRRSERALEASEALKAAILDSGLDAIITIDHEGKVVEWNPAAERTFGYRRADVVGREMAGLIVPPLLREAHRRGLAHYLATGDGPVLGRRIEITAARADGTQFPIELAITPIPADGPPMFTAHVRDITDRKASEGRRNARLAVTEALAGAATPAEAAAGVLRAVCEGLGWDLGALWAVDADAGLLRCLELWHSPSADVGEFEAETRRRTMVAGEGLPGRVWRSGERAWVADVTSDPNFPRAPFAGQAGLHGAFAFPVRAVDKVLGVVEFFSGEVREPDPDLLEMMDTVGGQVGLFLERKRAEEALRASEERLRLALEAGRMGTWSWDIATNAVAWSPGLELIHGLEPGTFPGTFAAYQRDIHPDDRRRVLDALARSVEQGTEHHVEYRLALPDGRAPWVEARGKLFHDVAGRPAQLVGVCMDVSERKQAEARLAEQTRIAESLNRIGVLLAAEHDLERLVQVVTDEATRLTDARFGAFFYNVPDDRGGAYTLYTISGVPIEEFSRFPMPRATELFAPTFRGEGPVRLDDVTLDPRVGRNSPHRGMPEGHLPVKSYLAVPVVSRSGEVLGGLFFGHPEPGIFDEADERLTVGIAAQAAVAVDNARLYREVQESERRFRQLADAVPQIVWAADGDGATTYYNRRWYDYTGLTAEQSLSPGGWKAAVHPDDLAAIERAARSAGVGGEFEAEYRLRDRAGTYRWHLGRSVPVVAADGRALRQYGSATDIDDRRRDEEELRAAKEDAEAANRAKSQFLAVLSHELRTPLNPILLAASSMLERPADPDEVRPTLEMIRQNVNLQARLIDDLLDVMRIVRGKMPLHWEVADGHGLIRQALQMCQSEIFGKELRLKLDLAAHEHYLNADSARFQQVIWNLVKNAVKFTPGGGVISIRTRNPEGDEARNDQLIVEVSDTGIGIDREVLPLIFDPFQQGETRITRKFGGLGLGLAICRGIVEAHGGTLSAESPGRDQGTTFRVVLTTIPSPAATETESPTAVPSAVPGTPSPLRILAVEDEPATLRLMARLLRGLGHTVTMANSIATAYSAYEAGEFDLIISDIGLPDGSGLELMRRVVALRGRVAAIALTGYGMEEDIQKSREAGFTAHMTKPIDFTKLEAMIAQVAATRPSGR